jgi:hypothetical protein
MRTCLGCSVPMATETPFFELLVSPSSPSSSAGHQHVVCIECFGLLHAKRACRPFITCPMESCGSRIIGLQRPFYALSEASKTPFFERKYTINYAEDVAEDVEREQEEPVEARGEQPPLEPLLATPERAPPVGDSDTPFVQEEFSRMSLFSP